MFIHLLKRAWKNRRVKWNIFGKSSLNFTFGQINSRKSNFVRPYSRTDEELDGYLVLILFMLKKKKSFPSKKPWNILVKGDIQKETIGLCNNLVHKLHVVFSNDISREISKLHELISNWYKLIIPVAFSNPSTRDTFFMF